LPLTENIDHRAAIYIEDYAISAGLRTGDAFITATAVENTLVVSNVKHFKVVKDLQLNSFKP
jgi:predicted nucleic acid-binding protein